MSEDKYPLNYLLKRLFDLALFLFSVFVLLLAVVLGLNGDPSQKTIIGLGMIASTIGALLDYRQKTIYELDHIETSLLSNELEAQFLNCVAKLRHKFVSTNVLIVVLGIWVSGYGLIWGDL